MMMSRGMGRGESEESCYSYSCVIDKDSKMGFGCWARNSTEEGGGQKKHRVCF